MDNQGLDFIRVMVDQILEAMAKKPGQLEESYGRLSSGSDRWLFRAALKGKIAQWNWDEDIQKGIKKVDDIDKVVGLVADLMLARLAEQLTPTVYSIAEAHAQQEVRDMVGQVG